ncbi:MAG: hypothetical protein HGA78_02040 [Nitrospirales bacterium]|nr:hypothetical protein [Nitrospirales bacterium]
MKKTLIQAVLAAAFALTLLTLACSPQRAAEETADCEIGNGACMKEVKGKQVILDIRPKPVEAMKDLTFRVETESGADEIHADLTMPGMYMGENRLRLKKMDGGYEARGVLPRCPSGKRLWQLTLQTPETGEVSFRFYVDR